MYWPDCWVVPESAAVPLSLAAMAGTANAAVMAIDAMAVTILPRISCVELPFARICFLICSCDAVHPVVYLEVQHPFGLVFWAISNLTGVALSIRQRAIDQAAEDIL